MYAEAKNQRGAQGPGPFFESRIRVERANTAVAIVICGNSRYAHIQSTLEYARYERPLLELEHETGSATKTWATPARRIRFDTQVQGPQTCQGDTRSRYRYKAIQPILFFEHPLPAKTCVFSHPACSPSTSPTRAGGDALRGVKRTDSLPPKQ